MGIFSKRPAPAPPPTSAPRVGENYYREILTTAGFPYTDDNLEALCRMVGEMMLIKAWQFISTRSQPQAEAFTDAHILNGDATPQGNQRILDDLVAWDRDVAPYIDDLPSRIRRILLEAPEGSMLALPKDQSLQVFMERRDMQRREES